MLKAILLSLIFVYSTIGIVGYFGMQKGGHMNHENCPFASMATADCDMSDPIALSFHHISQMQAFASAILMGIIVILATIFWLYILYAILRPWVCSYFLRKSKDAIFRTYKRIFYWISLHNKHGLSVPVTGA